MNRRYQFVVALLLVASLVAAGIGIVVLSGGADDTKSTADQAAAKAGGASAAADTNSQKIARLKAEQARTDAEVARLRQLVTDLGGNPGPDLRRDTNRDGDVDLGTPTPSPQPTTAPSSRPSPRPSPTRAPSPTPSPRCLLHDPLSGRCLTAPQHPYSPAHRTPTLRQRHGGRVIVLYLIRRAHWWMRNRLTPWEES